MQSISYKTNMGRAMRIRGKVYDKISDLEALAFVSDEPVAFEDVPKDELKKINTLQPWTSKLFACSWFNFKGKVPQSAKGKHVAMLISICGEGEVYDDQMEPLTGLTVIANTIEILQPAVGKRLVEISPSATGEEVLDFWVEGGFNKRKKDIRKVALLLQKDIVVVNDDIKALYYDYLYLTLKLRNLDVKSDLARKTVKILDQAYKVLGDFSSENIAKSRELLQEGIASGDDSTHTAYCVGHAHLDLAWLWPLRETKRKAVRTFTNQIENLEKYDEYIFGMSQPQQLEWMEQNEPKVFKKLQELVAKDKIEIQGGLWVECDVNVSSGESIIRQNIYGQKYWLEKFGKMSNICWLPDAFGFNANLPQICKKCGMDNFLTIKISWNEHNKFPHQMFKWQGIDGTTVVTAMPPTKDYNSEITPKILDKATKLFVEKDKINIFPAPFGIGDGGGGPGEGHIEMVQRHKYVKGATNTKFASAAEFFKDLEQFDDVMQTYEGELYLEKHQGTFTTQSRSKWYNRKLEYLFHNAEFFSVLAEDNGFKFPKDEIDVLWKEYLLYQFHDILPGSSIKRVYDESVERYQFIEHELNKIIDNALSTFTTSDDTIAINTNGFDFDGYIEHDDSFVYAQVKPYSSAKVQKVQNDASLNFDKNSIENDKIKVTFNDNGEVVELTDKGMNKQFSKKPMNVLAVYDDKKLHYNAWDIDINYTKQTPKTFELIKSKSYVTNGAVIRENTYKFNRSKLVQKVILNPNSNLVTFDTHADWHESDKMLRAEFEPTVFSNEVTCDIQLGNFKRSTKDETPIEKAQFEICAHKWVDVSSDNVGVAILTDSKYGWRVKEGKMSLNLLRSTRYPDELADRGEHNFKYAIMVHEGNCYDANVAKAGYIFNNPPKLAHSSISTDSFASVNDEHIVIETIKPSEDLSATIIRLYEDTGSARNCSLKLAKSFSKAVETDMLEHEIADVDLNNLSFKPFEIKTIKLV